MVFVGAGNVATHLAKALYRKGHRILQIYSRAESSARTLAEIVEADYTTGLRKLLANDVSLYVVSLTDAAFTELLPEMTTGKEQALWVHTAG
ncbi:hypothetical protein EZS27_029605, partial [termite gut metagenome]